MKIVKNNIEYKGEKYRAVIKIYGFYTDIVLFKRYKLFPIYKTHIGLHEYGKSYIEKIKIALYRYDKYLNNKITKSKEYQDLQEWNGVIE